MPKATNICAAEAKEIKYLPNNTVLISINEEYGELYPLQIDRLNSSVLTLRFSDITSDVNKDGIIYHKITDEIALKIIVNMPILILVIVVTLKVVIVKIYILQ